MKQSRKILSDARNHGGVIAVGLASGSIGALLVCWGVASYRHFADIIVSADVIGAAIGAAIPVVVSLWVSDRGRRRQRDEDIRQAVKPLRSLIDALTILRECAPDDASWAIGNVEHLAIPLRKASASQDTTDAHLRRAFTEGYDAYAEHWGSIRFSAKIRAGIIQADGQHPEVRTGIDQLLAQLEAAKDQYASIRRW